MAPSLSKQYSDALKNGAVSYPSDITICCRIKRPIALGQRESNHERGIDISSSALSMASKRSGNSAKRHMNNHSTLRSSTQSLMNNNMTSARSIRSNHSVHSTNSKQGSARKATGRSSSLLQIYSSNTGRSLTRNGSKQLGSRKGSNSNFHHIDSKRQSLVGTGTFGGRAGGNSRMNRSMLSNRSDKIQTPVTKHSRKSSSVSAMNNHNSST